jgi:predicted small secreted protein
MRRAPRRFVPALLIAALALTAAACEQNEVDPGVGADIDDTKVEQNWDDIAPGEGGDPSDFEREEDLLE